MKGGKTRIQRAMVMASGKLRFVKNIHRGGGTHRAAKTKHKSYGGLRSTTKKGKGSHRRGSLQQSVERIAQGAALIAPGAYRGMEVYNAEHNAGRALIEGISIYGGLQDGQFHGERLVQAWTPTVAFTVGRVAAHKLIGLIRRM